MATPPLNFGSELERQKWIIQNADYFTVFRYINRTRARWEFPTLAEAEAAAKRMLLEVPEARFLIYAVAGERDTFIKAIIKD